MAGEQEQAQEAAAAQKASATQKSDPDPELEPVATPAVANGSAGAPKKKKKEALKPIITTETPQPAPFFRDSVRVRLMWRGGGSKQQKTRETLLGLAAQAGCCGQAKRRAGEQASRRLEQHPRERRPDLSELVRGKA
ncbi:hypothetical protein BN1708_014513 [Verticillium longisporum]|uniref:Uncharacterized protein n=1 Tax=Verticillium longisporum TaxID=100787 RepID=A0A0G4LWJ7_VERLO|nr:hypothetical protein HYQ44_004154 [Verticillium longisporum]CRK26377.1 hypothetical protein BN1708_014513 [Verticillium longisporum]